MVSTKSLMSMLFLCLLLVGTSRVGRVVQFVGGGLSMTLEEAEAIAGIDIEAGTTLPARQIRDSARSGPAALWAAM